MEERLPCPTCRTPVELAAEMCLQCGARLFVDVILRSPVNDGRTRYRLSRALAQLPGAPPATAMQNGLLSSPPVVARRVTRAFAHEALSLLAENNLRGTIEKHVEKEAASGIQPRTLAIGIGAVALLALAFVGWQKIVGNMAPRGVGLTADDVPLRAGEPGQRPAPPPARIDARELARRGLQAAASLRCSNSVGSGIFIAADLVVTNAHVLCPAGETIRVSLSDERSFNGEVVRRDDNIDLGLVRVTGAGVAPLPLGDVGEIAVGDRVTIVGSPVGLDFSVQEGSLSSLQRSSNGVAYLQLDAKVSPGNSGGPVIDAFGRVVGIVSMKVTGQGVEGIGLAIPINYVYSPTLAYVAAPSAAAAASAPFRLMVARAQGGGADTGLREARSAVPAPAAAEPADDRPLLVAGRVDQYGNLVVRVVRITEFPPRFEEIAVTVSSGLDAFCTIKGDIATWKQGDASLASAGLDTRTSAAVASIAGSRTLFVGESALRWDLCDRTKMRKGIVIELQGANPVANQLEVR